MTQLLSTLQELRNRPIPDLSELRQRRGYRDLPIDEIQPLYNEPLIDIATLGIEGRNHYNHADNPPYYHKFEGSIPQLFLRESVARKLAAVDARLREFGLKLFVYDAYRPTEVQAHAYNVWMPAKVKEEHPDWDDDKVMTEVKKFWAAPTTDAKSPAPHKTGGAVDLTIVDMKSGKALPMGSQFDEPIEAARTDWLEAAGRGGDQQTIANRRLLYWVMSEEGFAGNPGEWWHFSFGDQLWAQLTGAQAALYGPAEINLSLIEQGYRMGKFPLPRGEAAKLMR